MTSDISIDINCDLGEGETVQDCVNDAKIMPFISSCNIACGGHSGNLLTIKESIKNALAAKIKIGAHPGYPDKKNFGRKTISLTHSQIEQMLVSQIDLIQKAADEQDCLIHHVKLHGALYHDVESNPDLARVIAVFLKQKYPSFKVISLAGGEFSRECKKSGLQTIPEGFMDRKYTESGMLTPRSQAGSVIQNRQDCINQAIALATHQPVDSDIGSQFTPMVESICLHSDTPGALELAGELAKKFKGSGIAIQ